MTVQFKGANLAGGDTAYTGWAGSAPVSGTHYLYVTNADIDYLVSKGCNCFRLLFSWEALQPKPTSLIPSSIPAHKTYFDKFKAIVDYATSKGVSVIIDIHSGIDADFAAYYGAKIGTTYQGFEVSALFADLWSQLATIFKGNSKVMFGICNEPSNMPTMVWFAAAQRTISAIRAAGSTNKIVLPGNGFTAASSWSGSLYTDTGSPPRSNAYGWLNANGVGKPLVDPANNLAAQVHLYANSDAGGGSSDVVSGTILADRVKSVVEWGRANKVQVFVAEVGLAASAVNAPEAWKSFSDYCDANSDVVLGWTFWAAGSNPWWISYRFSLCPSPDYKIDSAQMKMIAPSLATTVDPTLALKAQIADLQSRLTTLQAAYDKLDGDFAALKAVLGLVQSNYNVLVGKINAAQAALA